MTAPNSKPAPRKEYFLDPDYRERGNFTRTPPFCVRCQQKIDPAKAVKVTVNYATMMVSLGGEELMGKNCWKEISK